MLSALTDAVDRRFLFSSLLPSLLFSASLTFVWWADADPARARELLRDPVVPIAIVAVAAVLLAVVLAGATGPILRLYEGYWRGPFASAGRRRHRRRLDRLADRTELIHLRYPLPSQPEEVMATRFGNILRSAELYPRDRYGADTAMTWPRLYPVLPDRMVSQVGAARGAVDLLITTSFLAGVFALAGGGYLLATGGPWWRFLACFWGGAVVAWLAYLGALPAAVTYGQHIRSAFDLYRGDLLEQLGMGEGDEREQWRRLGHHWLRNIPLDLELEPDEPAPVSVSSDGGGLVLPLGFWLALAVLTAGTAGGLVLS